MTFSTSGTTITQTGTDTSLSGLNGLAGITTTSFGYYTRYTLAANYKLVINGTLSWNTSTTLHQLYIQPNFSTDNIIRINGSVTIGVNQNLYLQTFAINTPAILQEQALTANAGSLGNDGQFNSGNGVYATMWVAPSATLRLYGSILGLTGSLGVSATATEFTAIDSEIRCEAPLFYNAATLTRVRYYNTGSSPATIGLVNQSLALSGFEPYRIPFYLQLSATTPVGGTFSVSGIPSLPSAVQLLGFGGTTAGSPPTVNFYNLALGSGYQFDFVNSNSIARYYIARLWQQVALSVNDSDGINVQNALVYITGKSGSTAYTATTDASGGSGTLNIELVRVQRTNLSSSFAYYSISDNTTDDFAFRIYQYSYQIGVLPNQILKSQSALTIPWTLFADSNVTLSSAAAAALTTIASLSDFYDVAKYWKVQSANVTYPTTSTQPINASGTTLVLGNQYLTIDPSASPVFAVDTGGDAITIKANSALAATAKFDTISSNFVVELFEAGDWSVKFALSGASSNLFLSDGGIYRLLGSTFGSGVEIINNTFLSDPITAIVSHGQNPSGDNVTVQHETEVSIVISLSTGATPAASVILIVGGTTIDFEAGNTGSYTYTYRYAAGTTPTVVVRVRQQGFVRYSTSFVANSSTQSITVELSRREDLNGNPLYQGQSSSLINISIDAADLVHKILIGNGTVTASQIFDEIQDAIVTQAGMEVAGLISSYSPTSLGSFLLLGANVQLKRANVSDSNAAVRGIVTHELDTLIDNSNGDVAILGTSVVTAQEIRDAMALALSVGTEIASTSLDTAREQTDELWRRQGLDAAITANVLDAQAGTPGHLTTSDSSIDQTLTKEPDGSVTISRN